MSVKLTTLYFLTFLPRTPQTLVDTKPSSSNSWIALGFSLWVVQELGSHGTRTQDELLKRMLSNVLEEFLASKGVFKRPAKFGEDFSIENPILSMIN